jgi:hypothetical protein
MNFMQGHSLPPFYKLDSLPDSCYHILTMCNHLWEADMVRTQIQLPEEQLAMLKKMAAADHKSMAEIIRQSVDYFAKTKYGGERSSVADEQWRLPVGSGPGSRIWQPPTMPI